MTLHGPIRAICMLGVFVALLLGMACRDRGALALTREERVWLEAHPVLRWAPDPGYPPIEWVEGQGAVKGLAPDYLARIGESLGVRFEPVLYPEWPQAVAALQAGKVDLLSNITDLPERRSAMRFSQAYLDVPSVLLTRTGDGVKGLGDLRHRRLALERGYIILDMVRRDHPDIDIVEVHTTEDALQDLALGTVDGTIADLAQASWTIEHRQLRGIRMVCRLPQFPSRFSMAVRHDQEVLAGILEKGLAGISPAERREMHRKWISLQVLGWRPTRAFWGALAGGLGLSVLVLVLAWNLALHQRVERRTRELERTTRSLASLNAELVRTIAEVRTLRGFIPICMKCKKIRNDGGYWDQLEAYLAAHSEARFSHGYCPDCLPAAQEEMRRELGMPGGSAP